MNTQVVENDGGLERTVFIDESAAILEYHGAGRHTGIVLRGNVDPIVAHRTGIDFADPFVLGNLALWHARLSV
jgi:hypothetical protein